MKNKEKKGASFCNGKNISLKIPINGPAVYFIYNFSLCKIRIS